MLSPKGGHFVVLSRYLVGPLFSFTLTQSCPHLSSLPNCTPAACRAFSLKSQHYLTLLASSSRSHKKSSRFLVLQATAYNLSWFLLCLCPFHSLAAYTWSPSPSGSCLEISVFPVPPCCKCPLSLCWFSGCRFVSFQISRAFKCPHGM